MTFKSGFIVAYEYLQGSKNGRRLGRVLKVRDTEVDPITYEAYKHRPKLLRSKYLLTVRETDGKCRQFYGHALYNAKKVGLLGRIVLWLTGVKV